MNRDEFFAWCHDMGLASNGAIADAFRMSAQTVRNWRGKGGKDGAWQVPRWTALACLGLEALREDPSIELPREMGLRAFARFQKRNGLKTYERTGLAFGLTRQAVHNWFQDKRRFPHWVPLACLGYERWRKTSTDAAAHVTDVHGEDGQASACGGTGGDGRAAA